MDSIDYLGSAPPINKKTFEKYKSAIDISKIWIFLNDGELNEKNQNRALGRTKRNNNGEPEPVFTSA